MKKTVQISRDALERALGDKVQIFNHRTHDSYFAREIPETITLELDLPFSCSIQGCIEHDHHKDEPKECEHPHPYNVVSGNEQKTMCSRCGNQLNKPQEPKLMAPALLLYLNGNRKLSERLYSSLDEADKDLRGVVAYIWPAKLKDGFYEVTEDK